MSWIVPGCLLFTGILTWLLGLGSIGLWVGCYFECPTGRDTEFNYYVAVWTGAVAFFAGIFHMAFCCGHRKQFNKYILRSAACCSFILLPCTLLCVTLSGYLAWREWDTEQLYRKELDEGNNPVELQGDYITGIALYAGMALVGLVLLILTLIFNCYHCCGNSDSDEEEVEISIEPLRNEGNPRAHGQSSGPKASYNHAFYNPPPPEYVREANTVRGPAHHFNYGNTTSDSDYYGNQGRSDHYHDYNRSSADYRSPANNDFHDNSRRQPSTYSHPPQSSTQRSTVRTTRNHNHNRQNHRYNYGSHPTHMRGQEGATPQVPMQENPWSFGSREDVGSSSRMNQTNYY